MPFGQIDTDLFQFHAYRDLSGAIQTVTFCRRNGRAAACFGPSFFPALLFEDPEPEPRAAEEFFANLTDKETRTWQLILEGRSISEVADEEGVSRTAIYERIRGNTKGEGGMVNKNALVRLWWTLRKESSQDDQLL